MEKKCDSVAFPLISSGIYGYPKSDALSVASLKIQDFLADHDLNVYLVVFDKAAFAASKKLYGQVASYIDEHYTKKFITRRRERLDTEWEALEKSDMVFHTTGCIAQMETSTVSKGTDGLFGKLDEPFSQMLMRLIDAKDMTDVAVYKRANLDRRLFSKIRSNKSYMPSKRTAIALAVALELSLDETDDLLERAGYALSHAVKFDVIVEYFIANGKYNVFEINEVLFKYDQPLLGG